jgi:hypothetical protein
VPAFSGAAVGSWHCAGRCRLAAVGALTAVRQAGDGRACVGVQDTLWCGALQLQQLGLRWCALGCTVSIVLLYLLELVSDEACALESLDLGNNQVHEVCLQDELGLLLGCAVQQPAELLLDALQSLDSVPLMCLYNLVAGQCRGSSCKLLNSIVASMATAKLS